jgi:hypothetical protein
MLDQNDSIIVLSTDDATRPIEPGRPAARSRCPKTQDVCCDPRSAWTMLRTSCSCSRDGYSSRALDLEDDASRQSLRSERGNAGRGRRAGVLLDLLASRDEVTT